jgi:hypothetical protein
VPTDRQTRVQTADAALALTFPAGFSTAAASLEVRLEPGAPGLQVGDGATALRAFRVTAATAEGAPVTAFEAPVTICAAFSWAEAQGLAQGALAPYWVDPGTGALRTEGLAVLGLEEATPERPGRLCFTTTHFTAFVVAVGPLATPTAPPTATPTATPTDGREQPTRRVLLPLLPRPAISPGG